VTKKKVLKHSTPDGVLELVVDDHTGSLRAGSADEHHDAATAVRVRCLFYKKSC